METVHLAQEFGTRKEAWLFCERCSHVLDLGGSLTVIGRGTRLGEKLEERDSESIKNRSPHDPGILSKGSSLNRTVSQERSKRTHP